MLNVAIILGSTRPNRVSEPVGKWALERAKAIEGWNPEIIDLRDWPLPFYQEDKPVMMLQGAYSVDLAKKWAAKIAGMDAFIVVAPEYNYSFPAVLKNAFDYLFTEWNKKPAGFIGYGSVGGTRSVEQLRLVAGGLQMHAVREAVHLMDVWSMLGPDGFKPNEAEGKKMDAMLAQLDWWARALKTARNAGN